MICALKKIFFPTIFTHSPQFLQIPFIIAQVGYQLPKTKQEIRYTTAAGTVIQLMGTDGQYDLPSFPIVLAYNRINHYTPTVFLSKTSLADWRLAQMYRHLVCAGDFYSESQEGIHDKQLEKELHVLGQQMDKIKDAISERAKRGMFAATSVPISLTGPPPKRSDKLARFQKDPKSSKDIHPILKLPEPQFSLLPNCQMDTVCVPDIYEDNPSLPRTSDSAPAGSSVGSASSSGVVQEIAQSAKPRRAKQSASQKISATSEKAGISETPDNTKDSSYVAGHEEEEVEEDQPTSTSSSQQQSLLKGIPMGHKKRKVAGDKDPKIYRLVCAVCNDRFQRSNDKKDHIMVVHHGKFYDCLTCMKHFKSDKAFKAHIKTKHEGKGKVKCNQEGCPWVSNDPGQLHDHLLKIHEIGEPIVCKMENSDGKVCGKVFVNTRSFQSHRDIHQERKYECEMCNRLFTTEEHRHGHIKKYHNIQEEDKFQCDICGKVLDLEIQLVNHKKVHKLLHHRMIQASKKEKEKQASASEKEIGESSKTVDSAPVPSEQTPQEDVQISHPSTGYDLETAMDTLEGEQEQGDKDQ